jgi:nucleoside-diphosphate-sugar epimerase
VLRSALRGIHAMVIVPSMVYGQGRLLKKDSAQIPALMRAARQMGAGVYVGTGAHCWSNVHVDDLADLFLLMLERARPGTCTFAENGIASFRELAQAIHHRLGLAGEPRSLTPSEASDIWGPMMSTIALGSDCRMSADKARKVLGWAPRHGAVAKAI